MKINYIYKDKTPEKYACGLAACPTIYEGFKKVAPESHFCGVGVCPAIYSSEQKDNVYLIIGKLLPKDSLKNVGLGDLEKKIGEDEVLIEVPKELIDNFKK